MLASGGDDLVADGVANEVGYGMQIEFVHDVGPMRIHRLDADAKRDRNLFVGLAFGQELNNLPLACRQLLQWAGSAVRNFPGVQVAT